MVRLNEQAMPAFAATDRRDRTQLGLRRADVTAAYRNLEAVLTEIDTAATTEERQLQTAVAEIVRGMDRGRAAALSGWVRNALRRLPEAARGPLAAARQAYSDTLTKIDETLVAGVSGMLTADEGEAAIELAGQLGQRREALDAALAEAEQASPPVLAEDAASVDAPVATTERPTEEAMQKAREARKRRLDLSQSRKVEELARTAAAQQRYRDALDRAGWIGARGARRAPGELGPGADQVGGRRAGRRTAGRPCRVRGAYADIPSVRRLRQ